MHGAVQARPRRGAAGRLPRLHFFISHNKLFHVSTSLKTASLKLTLHPPPHHPATPPPHHPTTPPPHHLTTPPPHHPTTPPPNHRTATLKYRWIEKTGHKKWVMSVQEKVWDLAWAALVRHPKRYEPARKKILQYLTAQFRQVQ